MEESINLQQLLKTLRKRWLLILLFVVLASTIAGIISFYVLTPIYEAETQILVNQKNTDAQPYQVAQNVDTDLQLINTYNDIIKSPAILSKVIKKLDLNSTSESLADQVTIASANNSQVVNLTVRDTEALKAVEIANTVAEVFKEDIKHLMNVDNINILSEAKMSKDPKPIKPNKLLNIAIAVVIGLMIGVALAFLLETLDTTIKSEQDIEEIVGLPIIGLISPITEMKVSKKSIQSSRMKSY